MADTKITGLTAKTSPALTDILPIVEAPGSAPVTKKITVQEMRGGYVIPFSAATFDPADATTYYIGCLFSSAPRTTGLQAYSLFPRAGVVTAISLSVFINTLLGSNLTSTISFRLDDSADTTITSTLNLNSSSRIVATGLSITVATTDGFEIKWVTPSWATNPQGVYISGFVYVS